MYFYIYFPYIHTYILSRDLFFVVIVWHQINVVEYILIMSSSMLHFSQSLSHQVKDLFCRLEIQSFLLIFMNSIPWVPKWQHKRSILSSVERQHKKVKSSQMKFQDEKSAIKSLYFEMSQQLWSPKQIIKTGNKITSKRRISNWIWEKSQQG